MYYRILKKIMPIIPVTVFIILAMVTLATAGKPKGKKYLSQFDNSVIVADERYYTRAVLEYYLAKAIIGKFGIIYESDDPNNPVEKNQMQYQYDLGVKKKATDLKYNIMAISFDPHDVDQSLPKSLVLPIRTCRFKIPSSLSELTSGLEYRYYLFDGTMQASMQAFGMASGDIDSETQYLVIDYLQYKDCNCDGLPTIRYAAGLRTELKFIRLASKTEFSGIGSLASIAAQVQTGQSKVTFSLKSIGLTGPAVRYNIPSGVDFDVTTYREFQNAIDFLRKLETREIVDSTRLTVNPVIIPVLDDYRTNFESSLYDMVKEMHKLLMMRKKIIKKMGIDFDPNIDYCSAGTSNDLEKCNYQRQLTIIDTQLKLYVEERESSQNADKLFSSFNRYSHLLTLLDDADSVSIQKFQGILSK